MKLTAICLAMVATVARAEVPVKVGEGFCSDSWVSRYCEKYVYKERVFIVIFENGEMFRLVELTEDGEELIYQAPKRFWI